MRNPATVSAAGAPRFDGRGWTVGNQQRNPHQSLTEYVLPGQTVEDWKELVTSTVFAPPVPLSAFVDKVHASMADGCPSLVWKVIRQDATTALFEWRDEGCGGFPPQNELDRVVVDKTGLHRLAYAAKLKGPLPEARRKEWLDILSQVPLAEGTSETASAAPARSVPATPAHERSAEDLAAGARKSGWPCPKGVSAELKGGQGGVETWALACSNGQRYTVIVDPTGG
jgi:hypothetical protein